MTRIYALDAGTGELRWKRDTGAPVTSSPAVHGDLVIAGSRSYDLFALRRDDGAPAWNRYLWFSWVESSPAVRDGTVYVGSSDAQRLFALDAATGGRRWSFDTGGSAWAQPAVGDEAVYVGAVGVADYMVDHRGGFFAVDRESGAPLWGYAMERPGSARQWGFAASPAVDGELVYAATLAGTVYAFPVELPNK